MSTLQRSAVRVGSRIVPIVALAFIAGIRQPALAANCGGLPPACGGTMVVTCACGDTVVDDYILDHNIVCGAGASVGLRIANNVDITAAANVVIQGPGSGTGILFDGTSTATVIGNSSGRLGVTGWKVGIKFNNGANHNTVRYVRSYNNITNGGSSGDYGIDLRSESAATTTTNTLDQITSEANGDEGVHIGGGSLGTDLTGSLIFNNVNQQVYLANSNGNTIYGNWIVGLSKAFAALRLSNASSNVIQNNTIGTGNVMFTAGSVNNLMLGSNVIREGRLIFKPGQPDSNNCNNPPTLTASNNLVTGVDIAGNTNGCVVFEGSPCTDSVAMPHDNTVSSAVLRCFGGTSGTPAGTFDIVSVNGSGSNGTYAGENYVCNSQCLIDPTTGITGATRACTQGSGSGDTQDTALANITTTPTCP